MQDNTSTHQGDLLIVDDVADNLRVLSNMLSNRGYRVRAVRNGAMALVGAKSVPPDLILLDIRMPEMNGYEVCRQMKSDPQLCEIPIIFLSALDETADKVKAFEVGGADYVTKPFQMEEVLVRVANQLMIQRLRKQVTEQKKQLENYAAGAAAVNRDHSDSSYTAMMSEIVSILENSDRLSQSVEVSSEQYAGLRAIHHSSQTLLNLVKQLESSIR